MRRRLITVNDRMQHDYSYVLTEPEGGNFDPEFRPDLTPADLLALGVFGGKYMTDCRDEFPASWFRRARLAKHGAHLVGEVVEYEGVYRLCYIRGPEGLLIGLAEELR